MIALEDHRITTREGRAVARQSFRWKERQRSSRQCDVNGDDNGKIPRREGGRPGTHNLHSTHLGGITQRGYWKGTAG